MKEVLYFLRNRFSPPLRPLERDEPGLERENLLKGTTSFLPEEGEVFPALLGKGLFVFYSDRRRTTSEGRDVRGSEFYGDGLSGGEFPPLLQGRSPP